MQLAVGCSAYKLIYVVQVLTAREKIIVKQDYSIRQWKPPGARQKAFEAMSNEKESTVALAKIMHYLLRENKTIKKNKE